MRIDILTSLAKKDKTFTFEEALKISSLPRGSLKKVIYRLEQRGTIERIEKGKYRIIPLGAEKGKYTLNELIIGSLLLTPYCVAYCSALNFYGLTEQIPNAKTAPRNHL
jgi:predicted transcriptional regulator of viral defense system